MRIRLFVALLVMAVAAGAQEPAQQRHYVRATADATVTAKPDRARVSIGVDTQAPTAKEAAGQNAMATEQLLAKIKAVLGASGRLQTSGYSIYPHYEMRNGSNQQSGFDARNTVEATVDDLNLLPKLLDTATGAGANNIGGISFDLQDESPLRLRALADAAKKARVEAETIAKALGIRVVGVASAESGSAGVPVRPMPMMKMQGALGDAFAATPVEAGTVEVRASVTVTLEVNP